MNTFEQEQGSCRRRSVIERRELSAEAQEKVQEAAEKKLAARERAEQISREVKTTQQQIQNIIANMQQVVRAVAAIRVELQLAQNQGDLPSVRQDKQRLEKLKQNLLGLNSELKDLRGALLIGERRAVQEDHSDWSAKQIDEEADQRVKKIWQRLGIEK